MQKIRVELGERSYNIMIGNNMLRGIGAAFDKFEFSGKIAMISNPTVYALYGRTVASALKGRAMISLRCSSPTERNSLRGSVSSVAVSIQTSLGCQNAPIIFFPNG